MKAIIWKELRENFKWAALAMLCLTLAEFYALSTGRDDVSDSYDNLTLCSGTFLLVTSFGCALAGAAIGALQILPELRRDQWASLLHRPVSRDVIFFGKIVAGLLLYLFATVPAFAASAVYVATPGQFAAPFVASMLKPGLSDIVLGAAFYLASIFLCLHRGPWVGTRGLAALSIVPLFVLHLNVGWPFLLPILASGIYLFAGRAAMRTNGASDSQSKLERSALTALVYIGCLGSLTLALMMGTSLLLRANRERVEYRDFKVTPEGEVFLATQSALGDSGLVLTYPDGRLVTDKKYLDNSNGSKFCSLIPLTWNAGNRGALIREDYFNSHPRSLSNYIRTVDRNSQSKEVWYQLRKENYLVGYDKLSRRCVGYFGDEGYQPPTAPPIPFKDRIQEPAFPFSKPILYSVGRHLYAFNFGEREMKLVFDSGGESIQDATIIYSGMRESEVVAIALNDEIVFVRLDGDPITRTAYGHDRDIWKTVFAATNASNDRFYIEYMPGYETTPADPKDRKKFLDEVDKAGVVKNSYSMASDDATAPETLPSTLGSLIRPLLPTSLGKFYETVSPASSPYSRGTLAIVLGTASPEALLKLFGIGFVLGIATWFWAIKKGIAPVSAISWAVFVLCMGVPALISFAAVTRTTGNVRCPSCGAMRSVRREDCPKCKRDWEKPMPLGTEIFDAPAKP